MLRDPLQCMSCKHLHEREQQAKTGRNCAAFQFIPMTILNDEVDHRQPFEGDNGIQWEPKEPGTINPFDEQAQPKP